MNPFFFFEPTWVKKLLPLLTFSLSLCSDPLIDPLHASTSLFLDSPRAEELRNFLNQTETLTPPLTCKETLSLARPIRFSANAFEIPLAQIREKGKKNRPTPPFPKQEAPLEPPPISFSRKWGAPLSDLENAPPFFPDPTLQKVDFFLSDLSLDLKKGLKQQGPVFALCKKKPSFDSTLLRAKEVKRPRPLKQTKRPFCALGDGMEKKWIPPFSKPEKEKSPLPLRQSLDFAHFPKALRPFQKIPFDPHNLNCAKKNLSLIRPPFRSLAKRPLKTQAVPFPKKGPSLFLEKDQAFRLSPITKDRLHTNAPFHLKGSSLPLSISTPSFFKTPPSDLTIKEPSPTTRERRSPYPNEKSPLAQPIPLVHAHLRPTLSLHARKESNRSHRLPSTFLTETFSPALSGTMTYENALNPTLYYSKRDDGPGYSFCIKIELNERLPSFSRPQQFTFVIDQSSLIQKQRFGTFKEGVQKALSHLKEGDFFNILIADSKIFALSSNPILWNPQSVSQAKTFLTSKNHKKMDTTQTPFDLFSLVSKKALSDREHHVILMTDGRFLNSISHCAKDFKKLIEENRGKFSLFAATASRGNDLFTLDLLSAFNKGRLMRSKTNAAFPRELALLVKQLRSFVAKDLQIHAIQRGEKTALQLYSNERFLPPLYARSPYFIYGTIDELTDFDLILQARAGETWIHIKEPISFKSGHPSPKRIKKQMAHQKGYLCYDSFLENPTPLRLKEGQRTLETQLEPRSSKRQ